MKSALFLLAAISILVVLYVASIKGTTKEGFQGENAAAAPKMNLPLEIPQETPLRSGKGAETPFNPPSAATLSPPVGQTASVNSYPDTDPAMEKAPAGRIQSLHESIDGFLKRESAGLQAIGDPAVQLPLSTARSDAARLNDELLVLKRNPGLESTLTQEDLNGMEANYNYLEKKWRLSANSLSGSEGSEGGDEEVVEGFYSPRGSGILGWLFGPSVETFQSGSGSSGTAPAPATAASNTDDKPTLNDLKDLSNKIGIEIVRLNASGSTDPLIANRVGTLKQIQQVVDDLVMAVEQGTKSLADIPLTKTDIANFLPVMSNMNSPIPSVIDQLHAPQELNNLFSTYNGEDADAKKMSQELFNKYATDIFKNLSWSLSLDYKGEAEQEIARNQMQSMADARAFATSDRTGPVGIADASQEGAPVNAAGYNGLFDSVVRSVAGSVGPGGSGASVVAGAKGPSSASSGKPVLFDWKTRSSHICQQIAARGFDPSEFGCLAKPDETSEGFSWRGYARMICSRLGTIYDPGVPEACGCPPPTWPGWKP